MRARRRVGGAWEFVEGIGDALDTFIALERDGEEGLADTSGQWCSSSRSGPLTSKGWIMVLEAIAQERVKEQFK